MEGLTHERVIDPQSTRHRVHLGRWSTADTLGGVLDLIDHRQHVAAIARIPRGYQVGKDKPTGWLGSDAGLPAELCWAVAFAFDNGGHGGIVGIDECAVVEVFALGEPFGLGANLLMVAHGRSELQTETLALCITQGGHVCKVLFGLVGQGGNGLAQFQELVFGVSHQLHEDTALAATAAAKGPHDLVERLREVLGLAVQVGPPTAPLLDDVVDEL